MVEYLVRDESTFATFCHVLHYHKRLNHTAVIQIIPQYALTVKDSELNEQHRQTYRILLAEGLQFNSVVTPIARTMAELNADISILRQRGIKLSKSSGMQLLAWQMSRDVASLCIQRAYRRRILKRKMEQLSTLHYRYDSLAMRLCGCAGRASTMYYYLPENMTDPFINRGWHWIENQDDFETFTKLLRRKGVEDASLVQTYVAAAVYADLKTEEDLKGHSTIIDVMSTWNFNDENDMMERHRTGAFCQQARHQMKLDSISKEAARARLVLQTEMEKVEAKRKIMGHGVTEGDNEMLNSLHLALKRLEDRLAKAKEDVDKARLASIQWITRSAFSTYINRLALAVLSFRKNLPEDLYSELDAKQVRCGIELLLGGSKEICAAGAELESEDFDPAGEILSLLRVQRVRPKESGVDIPRAVKIVGAGLKRLKQLLRSDLYSMLEAEDLQAILYLEVIAVHKLQSEQEGSRSPHHLPATPAQHSHEASDAKLHPSVSFSIPKGLRRSDSKTGKGSFRSISSFDGALFRPEPHFVSKQEMRAWKSVCQVFSATRKALETHGPEHGSPLLIETLGLKLARPERIYQHVYVQPLLTFHVKMGEQMHNVAVPDWLDWDPTSVFYANMTTVARMALPRPLSSKVQTDGTPLIGGMIHELKELYTEGRPHQMSFTYWPTWKIRAIESRLREVRGSKDSEPELRELERKLQVCRRGVTVSNALEITLTQGFGVLRGDVLTLDNLSNVSDWTTIDGCMVYCTTMAGKSNKANAPKRIVGFNAVDKTCILAETSRESAESHMTDQDTEAASEKMPQKRKSKRLMAVVDQDVRYRLTAEIVFRVYDKDDERIYLRRLRAVPQVSQYLDNVFPFVDDEIVLPRAAALRMHVRLTQVLSAVRDESDDSQSVATTTPGHGVDEQSPASPGGQASASEGKLGWQVLDACCTGGVVAMHDFTLCKCLMLSVVKKATRRGGVQWSPLLPTGELDVTVPTPIAGLGDKRTRDEDAKALLIARPRLNRANVHMIPFSLAEFFGPLAHSAHSDTSMLAEPIKLALCDVSELHAGDADEALVQMGIKAVVDCGSARRFIPTPRGGVHGGKAVPLSAGGGIAPWQLASGRPSHEDIDYKLLPLEDLACDRAHTVRDTRDAADMFQEMLAFILLQLTSGRTSLVLLSFSDIAANEHDRNGKHNEDVRSATESNEDLAKRKKELDHKAADYLRHRIKSSGCLVVAGFFLWCVERRLQWLSWQQLAVDISTGSASVKSVGGDGLEGGRGNAEDSIQKADGYFEQWRTARKQMQLHLDEKTLRNAFKVGGVELFPDAAAESHDTTGKSNKVHPLLEMSQKLEALGVTEQDVMARLGLDAQEFDVLLVRDQAVASSGAPAHGRPQEARVGLEFGKSDQGISVTRVVSGLSAAKSNLVNKDDVLLEVDGQFAANEMSLVEEQLRGPTGSSVKLKLRRSTVHVLVMHRRHILSGLLHSLQPLRRVITQVVRAFALCKQTQEQRAAADKRAMTMFHYNTAARTGYIEKMQLDALLCDFLRNYELRLFGFSSLAQLSAHAMNVLALLPDAVLHRLSERDLEYAMRSTTIGFLVEQLERKLVRDAAFYMPSICLEDFVYLCRDLVKQDVLKILDPERTRFLRLHVPDAIVRQLNADQLLTMIEFGFVLNRDHLTNDAQGDAAKGRDSDVRARPLSGRRVDPRLRRTGGGRGGSGPVADGYQDNMFRISYADLDRMLELPVALLMQMGQDPPRSLPAVEVEKAKTVCGRERKGLIFVEYQPFMTATLDFARLQRARENLAQIEGRLQRIDDDGRPADGQVHSEEHARDGNDTKKEAKEELLAAAHAAREVIASVCFSSTVERLTFQRYCTVLKNTLAFKSSLQLGRPAQAIEPFEQALEASVDAAALSGWAVASTAEDNEFREVLEGYRCEELEVKGVIYRGWRRLAMMCEAGADLREWARFPLYLLQPAYQTFPSLADLSEAQDRVLEQQHVLWQWQARLAKGSPASPSSASVAPNEQLGLTQQQQQQQQQQQEEEIKEQLEVQRTVMAKLEADVRGIQKMIDLLPFLSQSNVGFVEVAAQCIRDLFKGLSGSEDEHAWTSAFPSAPGPLSSVIPDLTMATTNSFQLATSAANGLVEQMLRCQARVERAKQLQANDRLPELKDQLKGLTERVAGMRNQPTHTVFEGCRITVYAPASRRVLLQTIVSAYDHKKNQVRIADRLPESLRDVQKAVIKQREDAAAAAAAAAADAPEFGEGASDKRAKAPALTAVKSRAVEGAQSVETAPAYAIPWLDYLARAVPLSVAASGLNHKDVRFLLEKCLRIPASRNVPGPRPMGRPQVRFTTSAELGFPSDATAVELIVNGSPSSSDRSPNLQQHGHGTGAGNEQKDAASDPARQPDSASAATRAVGGGRSSSKLLASNERLLGARMPVVRMEKEGGGVVKGMVAIGMCEMKWARRGHLRVVHADGNEGRCQYDEVHAVLPEYVPGPCAYAQMTGADLSVLISLFRASAATANRKTLPIHHWECYAATYSYKSSI